MGESMETGKSESLAIGIDLGGTKVEVGLVDSMGKILSESRYPTNSSQGSEGIINDIVKAVKDLQVDMRALAIGVGAAGQVDLNGVMRAAPNLPFQDEPLQMRLEEELEIPVVVTNDVRAAAYGEWKYGSGRGVNDLVVIFVGTGIGGGVVSGGQLLEGCTNNAGELGHSTLIADGRKCRCPNYGCLEAYAGGWAIAERAQKAVLSSPEDGKALKSAAGGVDIITAETVNHAYREGDLLAKRLVEETGHYLGSGIVGIINAFNPCLLILGGGVIEGLPELIGMVDDEVRSRALKPGLEGLKIVKAALGGKAGVIGAAGLARKKLEQSK